MSFKDQGLSPVYFKTTYTYPQVLFDKRHWYCYNVVKSSFQCTFKKKIHTSQQGQRVLTLLSLIKEKAYLKTKHKTQRINLINPFFLEIINF